MRTRGAHLLLLATIVAGCQSPYGLSTGLAGTVVRGPVTPVCLVDVPCDAPFAATFQVRRGGVLVATFQSDGKGAFSVGLAPGSYVIVPAADAPIIDPASQAKTVAVGADGVTTVQLEFDTGIR